MKTMFNVMPKFICNQEKYILGGPDTDNIGLPLPSLSLPKTIEVQGQTLLVRSAFHVTLVAIGIIIRKNKIIIPDFLEKVVADFCEFTQDNSIDFLRFREEFRFAWQNDLRSVVAMCDVSNLDKFFDLVNEKYNLQLECPPTHVTLYTLELDKGIFLTNAKDIKEMTKIINNPGINLK